MKRLSKFACGIASIVFTLALVVAGLGFAVFGTQTGRDFVQSQTETAVERILGPDFDAMLGTQSIALGDDNSLAFEWSDVRVVRVSDGASAMRIATIDVGLRMLPLLSGRLEFQSLRIDGAEIDLTGGGRNTAETAPAAPAPIEPPTPAVAPPDLGRDHLRRQADAALAMLEGRFEAVTKLGIERVVFSDIDLTTPIGADGAPLVSRIDRAVFHLSDPRNLTFSAAIGVDELTVRLSGHAGFDPARHRLEAMHVTAGPVALGDIVKPASPDDRLDNRPFATDAALTLTADVTGDPQDTSRRVGRLGLSIDPGAVQTGRGHTRVEASELALSYREGDDRVSLAKGDIAFDDFSMRLVGGIDPVYDGEGGAFNGFMLGLEAQDMRSTIGADDAKAPPRLAALRIDARSDDAARKLRLTRFDLETAGGSLRGTGEHGLGGRDARTELSLQANNLAAADVKAFWPYSIAVGTRRWVLEHVTDAGRVSSGSITIGLDASRVGHVFKPGNHPDPEEMRLVFDLEGLVFSTMGDLPRIVEAKGRVETLGGDTSVTVESASVEKLDGVEVKGALLRFDRPASRDVLQELDGSVSVDLSGDLAPLLEIAARKPIDALRRLDLKPEDASGTADVNAKLFFLLGDKVKKEQQFIGYDVTAALSSAALKTPVEGRRMSEINGTLHFVPGAATAEVDAHIDGVPAKIVVARPFGDTPATERKLEISAKLSGERIADLAPGMADVVDGQVAARLTETADAGYRAEFDLSDASLQLPGIGWRKGRGVKAGLTLDVAKTDGDTVLKNIALKGDGFSASGTVRLDGDGIKAADLANVSLNPGDDVTVSMQRVSNGTRLRIDGSSFDARPFLKDLKDSLGEKTEQQRKRGQRQLDLSVAIAGLTGFGKERLADFSLDFAGSGGEIAALSSSGNMKGGGRFTIDVSPRGNDRSIQVRTSDLGRLIDFAGLYGRMEKGAASLDLVGSTEDGYRGQLVAENFDLVDEPRLSSIVGSNQSPDTTSLSKAIGKDLRTERAHFDHASAGIAYGKGGLRVADGIIRGPDFGSSFSGTLFDARNRIDIVGSFMPAYGINGIFRNVPLVGQILGNGREGGIIGITYKLDGAFAAPKLTVNPISAIAPGIFRSIFAYQ